MATNTKKDAPSDRATNKNKEKLSKFFEQQEQPAHDDTSDDTTNDTAKDVPDNTQVSDLKMKIEALEKELAEEKENDLRIQAELQNRLKRKDQEKDNALKFAQEKFFKDFLIVLDSIDGALMQDPSTMTVEQYREGLNMMSDQLTSMLGQFQVDAITPEIGSIFSPETSEAMSMQQTTEHPNNAVLVVVQKGYTYQGRLIRPARVIVSQNLEEKSIEK